MAAVPNDKPRRRSRRDQEAAQLRDWHERTGFSAAPLNRQEMEALIERSATSDEIQGLAPSPDRPAHRRG